MVKLNPSQQALVDGKYPEQTMLDAALALAKDGWHVFPLRPGTKVPLIAKKAGGNGAHDGTTDETQIRNWWKKWPNAGIGANLGDDRLVIDLDFQHGATRWGSLPDTRTHHSGRGNGNVHLVYRVRPGSLAAAVRSGTNVLGQGVDVRAGRGSYVVMPPTLHEETGQPYRIDPVLTREHTLTDEEVLELWEEAGVAAPATKAGKNHQRPMESSSSTLSGLKADPPREGGRNEWLAKVCGHLAKAHRNKEDVYRQWVAEYAALIVPPLSEEEVEKTADSIWLREYENHPERVLSEENGYLTGNKARLFCQTSRKVEDEIVYGQGVYADFDVEAKGVAVDDSSRRLYWVRLFWNGEQIDTTLPGEVLGSDQQFRQWLSARGMSVDPPFSANPKTAPATRVLRYLNSQKPPKVQIVTTLGWDESSEAFVTHEGVITAEGPQSKEEAGVVANPALIERDVAPYVYGFKRTPQAAAETLAEVLTFQEEETASVFGAWWAACLLKPQIQRKTSLFPFFGIEAASESGKTNGFFDLMVALNGNTRGQVVPTKPVLRDLASANKSGIVWADDLDSLEPYGELLRASTSNGTASKMEADRSGIRNTQVVAPILISGEALGFDSQKALVDRSVVLQIQSPKGRKSRHGDYPQWDDVVKLKAAYPESDGGLGAVSGWYVQHALAHSKELMRALSEETRRGTGRHGDKLAVLRAGARLLDSLVGHPLAWTTGGEHYQRVDRWTRSNEAVLSQDNALTIKLLPWALRLWDLPDGAEVAEDRGNLNGIRTPAFVKGDPEANETLGSGVGGEPVEIWYSPTYLAEAWSKYNNGRVDLRTESLTALQQQAQALGSSSRAHRLRNSGGVARYRLLPQEYVSVVLQRVQG